MLLQFLEISGKTLGRDGLLDHLNEESAPGDKGGVVALPLREVDLDGVVVALEDKLEHLGSLNVVGSHQSCADLLNGREEGANNLVDGFAILDLEPISCDFESRDMLAKGKQTIV